MTRARAVFLLTPFSLAVAAIAAAAAFSASDPAQAAGKPAACAVGSVQDRNSGACVSVGALADWELYREGRLLAHAGQYPEALAALEAIRDKDDAMILTMIGYSNRKLGAVDEGIAYYHRALAINPDSVNTREYLGEGYVSMGRFDLAEAELEKIEKICGTGCDPYVQLANAIAGEWE